MMISSAPELPCIITIVLVCVFPVTAAHLSIDIILSMSTTYTHNYKIASPVTVAA